MRRLLLLLALAFPFAPAVATPSDTKDVPEVVTAWFNDKALATVRSHAAEAFPHASADEVAAMRVGAPQKTAVFADQASVSNAITTSDRWIAPIMSGSDAVGAVSVNFASGVAGGEIVRGDERLGASIARDEPDVTFVWDPRLSAWFAMRESTIEPADSAGASVILGAVPLTDFLAQRERILTSSTPVPDPPSTTPAVPIDSGRNLPVVILAVLVVLGLLVGSLVWLRSEQIEGEKEQEPPSEDAALVHKRLTGIGETKMRFRDSAKKINVYKSPKKKDETRALSDD